MTRRKKTRKTGPLAAAKKPKSELDRTPTPSKVTPGKGRKPGSRMNELSEATRRRLSASEKSQKDPRIGSKKPVELVSSVTAAVTPKPKQKAFDEEAAFAELQALENDPRLQSLLERLDQEEELSDADLRYVDERTERFSQLAEQLGIDLNDDDEWEDDD